MPDESDFFSGIAKKTEFANRWFWHLYLAILYFVGIAHWVAFLNFGRLSFTFLDWKEKAQWLFVIKQAIETGIVPYHISFVSHSDKFFGLPNMLISPQIFLIPFMSVDTFFLVNTLILYSAGFFGLVLIARRYRLSVAPFLLLFLLFNFNGAITAHISVGHTDWGGYFLLTYFVYYILLMLEDLPDPSRAIKISLVLLGIFLQGSFQIYVSCLGFMVLIALSDFRYFKECILASAFSAALSAFRWIPTAYTFGQAERTYLTGFPNLITMLESFTIIKSHDAGLTPGLFARSVGWWECDFFIDNLGLLLILWFGIALRFTKRQCLENTKFRALDWPMIIMTVFSLNYALISLAHLQIPLSVYSRVGTRLILIPLVTLFVISAIRLENLYFAGRPIGQRWKPLLLSIVTAFLLGSSLRMHSATWSLANVETLQPLSVVDLSVQIIERPDVWYKSAVGLSAVVSAVSLACLLIHWRKTSPPEKTLSE